MATFNQLLQSEIKDLKELSKRENNVIDLKLVADVLQDSGAHTAKVPQRLTRYAYNLLFVEQIQIFQDRVFW